MEGSDIDELQRIWELKEKSAISHEEYLRLKAQILARGGSHAGPSRTADQAPSKPPNSPSLPGSGDAKANKWTFGCLGLFALLALFAVVGSQSDKRPKLASGNTANTSAPEKDPSKQKSSAYDDMLKREIASMRKEPGPGDIEPTKEAIMAETLLIGARAKAYEENAPSSVNATTKSLRSEYKRLAVRYQIAAFPKLRAAQAKLFDQLMWEQNIRVAAIGPNNRILRFTGGLFADNAAIAAARDNVADTMTLLRFDQDRYEWYRGSEYTYFKRSSLPDSAFANFDGSSWVKISD